MRGGAPAGHLEGTRAVLLSADPGSSQAAYKCSSPASTTTLSLFIIPSSVHTCARLHLKKKKKIPGIDWMLSDNIRQSVSQWIYNSESVEGLFRIDGSRLMSDRSHNSLE